MRTTTHALRFDVVDDADAWDPPVDPEQEMREANALRNALTDEREVRRSPAARALLARIHHLAFGLSRRTYLRYRRLRVDLVGVRTDPSSSLREDRGFLWTLTAVSLDGAACVLTRTYLRRASLPISVKIVRYAPDVLHSESLGFALLPVRDAVHYWTWVLGHERDGWEPPRFELDQRVADRHFVRISLHARTSREALRSMRREREGLRRAPSRLKCQRSDR